MVFWWTYALAATPTLDGVGSLLWGSSAPDGYEWCRGEFWATAPETLLGVPAALTTGAWPDGELLAVGWRFEGLESGRAARAALTRAYGAPYEPYRGDLFWQRNGLSVRLLEDDDGSAGVVVVPLDRLAPLRTVDDDGPWWALTLADARWRMGVGPEPAWAGAPLWDYRRCIGEPDAVAAPYVEPPRRAPPDPRPEAWANARASCANFVTTALYQCVPALQRLAELGELPADRVSCRRAGLIGSCWRAR